VYESWPGSASRFDTELYEVLRDVTRDVTSLELVPYLATGASDARFAEPLGVQVYGYGPMLEEPDASPTGLMHAHDERISLRNLELGLRCLCDATLRIAVKSG
jgi:acetylornithine deacetylase/succinyl-diaminopimelate desuccinylase-like protein